MKDDERPDAWQLTPRLRWVMRASELEFAGILGMRARHVLQQLWHIPNSEQYEWRDVPTVREGNECPPD